MFLDVSSWTGRTKKSHLYFSRSWRFVVTADGGVARPSRRTPFSSGADPSSLMETIWSCAALNIAFCLSRDLLQGQEQLLRRSFAFAARFWETSRHYCSIYFFYFKEVQNTLNLEKPYTSDVVDMKLTWKGRKLEFGCLSQCMTSLQGSTRLGGKHKPGVSLLNKCSV